MAAYLAVSKCTVDRIVAKRGLPFVLVGGRRRFREDDVLYYIASRSFGHRSNLSAPQDRGTNVS
ncbi:MAG: excisionase family DNA-binding protein [Acidobacteria bacterium]|nr:excisionase family DNA-binding protein [Acidobacteriota bacterium]